MRALIARMKAKAPAQPSASTPTRAPRSDGAEARHRLLYTALRLFAEKGFAKTSTREIAREAGVNIAAISYYFGDKQGLYGATFTEPLGGTAGDFVSLYNAPELPLEEALHTYFGSMIAPMKQGEVVRQCIQLHMREMLDPTSQWAHEIQCDMQLPHEALAALLCRHLGVKRADDDIHRLTFAITGLAVQVFISQDVVDVLRPQLLRNGKAIDAWAARMTDYALALVAFESKRRRDEAPASSGRKKK